MSRTRVKICGITRQADAAAAVVAGADAIGLVFYANSPRAVSLEQARQIVTALPPLVTVVGLFVNADSNMVEAACNELPLGLLQFHGDEDADYCAGFGLPWMKAIRVAPDTDIAAAASSYRDANAVLLDTWRQGTPGGTGERFDWQTVPRELPQAIVLAGGLDASNLAEAIAVARPYAVDVSGGVEEAPGVKSPEKMREFVAAVEAADRRSEERT